MIKLFDLFELPFEEKDNEQVGIYEEREGSRQIEEKIYYSEDNQ